MELLHTEADLRTPVYLACQGEEGVLILDGFTFRTVAVMTDPWGGMSELAKTDGRPVLVGLPDGRWLRVRPSGILSPARRPLSLGRHEAVLRALARARRRRQVCMRVLHYVRHPLQVTRPLLELATASSRGKEVVGTERQVGRGEKRASQDKPTSTAAPGF